MALKFYMDHNIPRSITQGLRIKHVDVLTAFEDGQSKTDDAALLQRATALNRVLFSMDDDLLGIAAAWQTQQIAFAGVVYAHQLRITIGVCVEPLELLAMAGETEDMKNQILFLPM